MKASAGFSAADKWDGRGPADESTVSASRCGAVAPAVADCVSAVSPHTDVGQHSEAIEHGLMPDPHV